MTCQTSLTHYSPSNHLPTDDELFSSAGSSFIAAVNPRLSLNCHGQPTLLPDPSILARKLAQYSIMSRESYKTPSLASSHYESDSDESDIDSDDEFQSLTPDTVKTSVPSPEPDDSFKSLPAESLAPKQHLPLESWVKVAPDADRLTNDFPSEEASFISASSELEEQDLPSDEDITTEQAIQTQKSIRQELAGTTPAIYISELPGKNILTAQFRKDPEGTIELLGHRLDALAGDVTTFMCKGDAPTRLEQLDNDWNALADEPTEDKLLTVIDGIRAYEIAHTKDSWLEKLNICFIGLASMVSSPVMALLQKNLPVECLKNNDASEFNLMDPTAITHQNRGRISSDPAVLSRIVSEFTNHETTQRYDERTQALLDTLIPENYPKSREARHPRFLIEKLARTRPDVVSQLFQQFLRNQQLITPASDHSAHQRLDTELAQVEAAGEDIEKLLDIIEECPELGQTISARVQHHYLNSLAGHLISTISAQVEACASQSHDMIEGLQTDLENAITIAEQLGQKDLATQLRPLRTGILQIQAIPTHRIVTSGYHNGEHVWYLDATPDLAQTAKALQEQSTTDIDKAIIELENYRKIQPGADIGQLTSHMKRRDELLKTQIEVLKSEARQAITDKESDRFEQLCARIRYLENERPDPQYLDDSMDCWSKAAKMGTTMLRGVDIPTEHTLQDLELERALKKGHDYDFNDECYKLLSALPDLGLAALTKAGEEGAKGVQGIRDLYNGKIGATDAAVAVVKATAYLGADGLVNLAKTFQTELTAAAAIGAKNPKLLRALAGNIAQAKAVAINTLAGNSPVVAMFDELHNRLWAEAATTYFLENVNPQAVTLDGLTPEELAAVKKIVTISKLMESAPYVPTLLDAAFRAYNNGTNVVAQVWNFASTGARLLCTRMIKNVNTLDTATVRDCNFMMDLFSEGLTVANSRQRMMARMGSVAADIACRYTPTAIVARATVLEPFKTLFNGFRDALGKFWRREKNSLTPLLLQAGQVASVFGPSVGASLILVATVASGGIAGIVAAVGMLGASCYWAWHRADALNHYQGLMSLGCRVASLVEGTVTKGLADLNIQVKTLMDESGYEKSIDKMAKSHGLRNLYQQNWNHWLTEQREAFEKAKAIIEERMEANLQQLPQELAELKREGWDLDMTDEEWLVQEAQSIKDDTEHKIAKAKEQHLWMEGARDKRLTELKQSLAASDTHNEEVEILCQQACMVKQLEDDSSRDYSTLSIDDIRKMLPKNETLVIPGNPQRRIYWLMALVERYRENLHHKLGSENIPASREDMIEALETFRVDAMMGSMLKQYHKPSRDAWVDTCANSRTSLTRWSEQRMVDVMKKTMTMVMSDVYTRFGKNWCSEGDKLTEREFEKARRDNHHIDAAIQSDMELVVSEIWHKVFEQNRKDTRRKLKDRKIDFADTDLPEEVRWMGKAS
ncbi:hypothetical protein [Sansalvadorimonas verongulae]|uniref:hypothetical protein n=1 Tax=Sansalvadorimonas verongulae TaxID=2172824 RepID=UPI0012BC17C9|nr:hypothetical protein [Sansalvadorimonas verongulae]MTI15407.1 hypothetical protein [Sansalvadorimonas verongulae]